MKTISLRVELNVKKMTKVVEYNLRKIKLS